MATATKITSNADGSLEALEGIIKMALKRTGVSKELDLCSYLSDERGTLSPSTYLRLKDTNREALFYLIKERILDADLHKLHKVQGTHSPYAGQALEECIKEAMAKVNVLRETSLCKYLPGEEGYVHHFTFLKMKSSNPIQLRNAIKEHILDRVPQLVQPKKRNRRNKIDASEKLYSSKTRGKTPWNTDPASSHLEFLERRDVLERISENELSSELKKKIDDMLSSGHTQIERLVSIIDRLIGAVGNKELFAKTDLDWQAKERPAKRELSDKTFERFLYFVQNQLIRKIRERQADGELWQMFLDLV